MRRIVPRLQREPVKLSSSPQDVHKSSYWTLVGNPICPIIAAIAKESEVACSPRPSLRRETARSRSFPATVRCAAVPGGAVEHFASVRPAGLSYCKVVKAAYSE